MKLFWGTRFWWRRWSSFGLWPEQKGLCNEILRIPADFGSGLSGLGKVAESIVEGCRKHCGSLQEALRNTGED